MALTWDQFGSLGLTAGQKTKLAAAQTIGNSLRPPFSSVDTSTLTAAQAKAILNFIADCKKLLGPAEAGAQYIIKKLRDDAAAAADNSVPSGSL